MEEGKRYVKWNKSFYDKYCDVFNIEVCTPTRKYLDDFLNMDGYKVRNTENGEVIEVWNEEYNQFLRYRTKYITMRVPESCLSIFPELIEYFAIV